MSFMFKKKNKPVYTPIKADEKRPTFIRFKRLIELLDVIGSVLSPIVLLIFLIINMMIIDAFATHVQFIDALEHGKVRNGVWKGVSSNGKLGLVNFDVEESGVDFVFLPTQYYSSEFLSALSEGQVVNVRYTTLPKFGTKGVLEDTFEQVKYYTGYLNEYLLPFVICWIILALNPAIILVGLPSEKEKDVAEGDIPIMVTKRPFFLKEENAICDRRHYKA
jgi:hypothetical protein